MEAPLTYTLGSNLTLPVGQALWLRKARIGTMAQKMDGECLIIASNLMLVHHVNSQD